MNHAKSDRHHFWSITLRCIKPLKLVVSVYIKTNLGLKRSLQWTAQRTKITSDFVLALEQGYKDNIRNKRKKSCIPKEKF